MISRKELCAALKINYYTLVRWDKAKKIPSYKIGKQYRYELKEVLNALQIKEEVS